jgi:hypothetical protein
VTEAPFVNGGSTAPGEIADLRRVGISPDFWYPVAVSASVWKEANHSRQSPGSDDDRSPCRSGSSRQESGTKKGRGQYQTPHSRGRHRRVRLLMYR